MNLLNNIQTILSNREIALLLWLFIGLIATLFSKSIRISFFTVVKILFHKTFLTIYLLLGIYLLAIILLLKEVNLWNSSHIKDTLFWLFTVGIVLAFKTIEAKESGYFKKIFLEGFKWTIILEFVANLYSFGLLTEIFLLPVLVFIGLTQAVSELDKKNMQLTNILSTLLRLVGSSIILFSIYKTIGEYDKVFTLANLNSLLLPMTITTLFIPFIYFLALYSAYETFFIRLDSMSSQKEKIKEVKKIVKRIANFSLDRLKRIMAGFEKRVFYEEIELKSYIKKICKRKPAANNG